MVSFTLWTSRENRFASTLHETLSTHTHYVIAGSYSTKYRLAAVGEQDGSCSHEWRKKREDRASSLITGLTGNAVRKVSFRI
jgi:hypothetical protein